MPSLDARLLIADIASGDKSRIKEATYIISEIDSNTDINADVFVNGLASTNDDVVFWSEIALEHIGERGNAAIPALIMLLNREQLFIRQYAVKVLASVGPKDKNARMAIFGTFSDGNPFVRCEALQACINLHALSTAELALIAAMSSDSDENVSRWSEITLRNIRLRGERTE